MPPPLAFFLCTAFVIVLLRIGRRECEGVSTAAWIPTLWMLAIASKPLGIWFGTAGSAESGSVLDRLLLVALAAAATAVLARRVRLWTPGLTQHLALLVLLTGMLVSTLWSEIPFIALRRWFREGIVLIMALLILSEEHPRRALSSVLRRSAYILIPYSVMLIKYFPQFGVDYARWSGLQMWVGVTLHKNTLGRLCLVSAFFLIWALFQRAGEPRREGTRLAWWADLSVLLLSLFLLGGAEDAYSATSLGTFGAGLVFYLWLRRAEA